jgi:predicted Ser/Thr protein kinase
MIDTGLVPMVDVTDAGGRVETRPGLLSNRYELLSVLASGGMGQVWRARDTLLNRPVAVKVLRSEFTGDPSFVARFRAEAQHAALLQHPNIAAVYDYGELEEHGEQSAYLVMELVEGESLASLLARERRLDVARSLSILRQTSAALAAAHAAGVVHRDVKPGNVLVSTDGTVKIADFGIAWSASSVPLTRTGQVIGTAHYLSPEQASGGKATPASDVYALGAVAYECLTGRRAFDGENSVQIAVKHIREEPDPLPADVPAPIRALVEHAMAKDPARRFADGGALLAAVDQVLATPSTSSGTVPIATRSTGTAVMPLPHAPTGASAARPAAAGPGHRTPRTLLAGGLVVATLLALGVALWGNDPASTAGESTTTTTPVAPTETTAPRIGVVATDYVGRPVGDVQAELVGLGLSVTVTPIETADVPAGQVTAVDPVGDLERGATVTVTYAVPPVPVPVPVPPAQPRPDTGEDSSEEDEDEGKGNGNGKGNGSRDGNGNDD